MKFIKSKKISQRLYLFVTAIDQTVIARPNFKIKDDCWQELPNFNSESFLSSEKIINTSIYEHVQKLINKDKYSFLYKNHLEKEKILETISEIELSSIFIKELEWLKRFGYYYNHTLAIVLLLTKFCHDQKPNKGFINDLLRAAFIHDIGLTRLPYNLLFSHDLFQDDDKLLMNQHTIISNLLVGFYTNKSDKNLGQIVLNHHSPEKINELNGENRNNDINNVTWMIHNMDIFDALISNRPFRPAYKVENAIQYLKQLNESLNLPLEIVRWLEKKFDSKDYQFFGDNLIPYNPELKTHQLN